MPGVALDAGYDRRMISDWFNKLCNSRKHAKSVGTKHKIPFYFVWPPMFPFQQAPATYQAHILSDTYLEVGASESKIGHAAILV